jgi:threonine dehydrogenase-like Zn-dependent dehydrogenase
MKAVLMEGPKRFGVKEVPQPEPDAQDVIVRVRACAVCGSDLTLYKMGVEDRILGHEFSGEVAAVGEQVRGWRTGDRVVVEPSIVCRTCYWCQKKQYNLCNSLGYTGLAADGGLAEFVKVPAYQLHRLPDELSFAQGALIEPLAVAIRGVEFSALNPDDTIAVFGCGAIGLFTMLWARYKEAHRIIATDVVKARIQAAQQLADHVFNAAEVDITAEILKMTDDRGPEVVFECSGNAQAQIQAVNAVQKGGRIILLGIGYETSPLMFSELTMKEISIKGSLGYSSLNHQGEFPMAMQAVKSGAIDLRKIPTQLFRLEETQKAFEALSDGEIAKAIILPDK